MFWLIPTSIAVLGGSIYLHAKHNPYTPIIGGAIQAYKDRQLARKAREEARPKPTPSFYGS